MCKVFAMTNVSQVKVGPRFLSIVRNEVCRQADQDGFGYAVLSKDGEIGGERTIRPLNFRPLIDPESSKFTKNLPIVLDADNAFGKIDLTNPKSLIAHGRLSTNTVSLINTHPFTNGEVALIHNGVVRDPTHSLKNLVSTCDSEILLRYWEKGGVDAIEKMVTGYYAVAVLDKHGLLHIVRDDRADLFIAYVRTVDSFMIATTSEIIKNVCKEMKWKYEHPEEILEKTYTVFDGNEILNHKSITPRTQDWGNANYDYNRGEFGGGYSTYESGKKTTETTQAASTKPITSLGAGDSEWDNYGSISDGSPESEPVPKYKELPGRVSTDSSPTAETVTGQIHSISDGSTVRITSAEDDMSRDERIESIASEVEEYRSRRAATGTEGA